MLLFLTKKTELDMSQVVETAGADCVPGISLGSDTRACFSGWGLIPRSVETRLRVRK